MKNAITTAIGILIAVLLIFGGIRACRQIESRHLKADSSAYWKGVADRATDSSKIVRVALDSTKSATVVQQKQWADEKSQLLKTIAIRDTAMNKEKARYGDLSTRYYAAKAMADTAGQLLPCDSAFAELGQAKTAVNDLQNSYGSAIQSFGSEINRRDSTIQVLIDIGYRFQRANDSLRQANDGQARDNVRLAKIAAKRFSVGPSIGAAVVGGKVQAVVGATVTYTIFRF